MLIEFQENLKTRIFFVLSEDNLNTGILFVLSKYFLKLLGKSDTIKFTTPSICGTVWLYIQSAFFCVTDKTLFSLCVTVVLTYFTGIITRESTKRVRSPVSQEAAMTGKRLGALVDISPCQYVTLTGDLHNGLHRCLFSATFSV